MFGIGSQLTATTMVGTDIGASQGIQGLSKGTPQGTNEEQGVLGSLAPCDLQ